MVGLWMSSKLSECIIIIEFFTHMLYNTVIYVSVQTNRALVILYTSKLRSVMFMLLR